ncbi:MAG: PKD domain-containing protein [Desulfomicrobium escambiense]|nr:PKD domain-containing protein [Desulfomicrobium escambiense]
MDVTFDASLSTDSDGRIVRYLWNFGDGSTDDGVVVKHEFKSFGTFVVTLTVTDDRGQSASLSKNVTVAATADPKPDFVVSPSAPVVGDRGLLQRGDFDRRGGPQYRTATTGTSARAHRHPA